MDWFDIDHNGIVDGRDFFIRDLDLLTIGLVLDMWSEKANDNVAYSKVATQEDFDRF